MSLSFRDWCVLGGFVFLCFGAAGLGSLVTTPALDSWYVELRKPAWTPPNWVFGPVWSVLYLGMAVAAWLVWRAQPWSQTRLPLFVFFGQLILNVLWSVLFFGLHRPGLAFAEILLLWGAIFATLLVFSRISTIAASLLVPYLVWVTFAAVLNFSLWQRNL